MLSFMQRAASRQPAAAPTMVYAVQGLNQEKADALRRIMTMLSGRTQYSWQPGPPEQAAVVILGPSIGASKADLADSNRRIARVTLSDQPHVGDVTCLEYPFRVFQVLSALQEIESELSPSAQPAQMDARLSSWALFDSLRQLASQANLGQWLVAHYPDGYALHVRDDLQVFAADSGVHARLAAGQLPEAELVPGEAPPPELRSGRGAELLWQVGMHSGRGNLSGSLDAASAYRLLAWPDFGVVRPQATHLRMSALLATAPHTRDELLILLGNDANIEAVNRFLNACAASGLLQADRRAMSPIPKHPSAPASSFVSGLVASIRDKLGFARRNVLGSN
jgi:hypothetical protein